jgi:hypothetical protein
VYFTRYLKAVNVDEKYVWLTNMIKCFLFHDSMASSYQALGWTDVSVQPTYEKLLQVGKVCTQWINKEVVVSDPKLVLTVGKPPCTLLHNVPLDDAGLQGQVYRELLGQLLKAGDSTAEKNIARNLLLKSSDAPPFDKKGRSVDQVATAAESWSPKPPARSIAITRLEPWSDRNVFHMLHPQAVMMAETGVITGLQAAALMSHGSKSHARRPDADPVASALKGRSLTELLGALPPGQQDQFWANAQVLETHAATLANLADALRAVKFDNGSDPLPTGDDVLKDQADALVARFHLADSAAAELHQLQAVRSGRNDRFKKLASSH